MLDSSSSNYFKGSPSASLSLSLLSDILLAEEVIVPFASDLDLQLQLQSFSPEARALVLITFGSVDLLPREQYSLPVLKGGECVNPGRVLATR